MSWEMKFKSISLFLLLFFIGVSGQIGTNVCSVKKASFISERNSIKVSWTADTSLFKNNYYLYTVCKPQEAAQQVVDGIFDSILIKKATDSLEIALNEFILFDTTYFVSLFVGNTRTTATRQGVKSTDTCKTGPYTKQLIKYFKNISLQSDTVKTFNGNVYIRKDSTYSSSVVTDSIKIHPLAPNYKGFITAGIGFTFVQPQPIPPLYIGIKINNQLDPKFESKIALYRDQGTFLTIERNCFYDQTNKIIWLYTNKLDKPFIALVDTQPPTYTILSDTSSVLTSGQEFTDELVISDNVGNVRWTQLSSKAEDELVVRKDSILNAIVDTVYPDIKQEYHIVTEDNSVKTLIYIDDGANKDTIDLSRRVNRSNDILPLLPTQLLKWIPLRTTAILSNAKPEKVFKPLCKDTNTWAYNKRYFRIFRWIPGSNIERPDYQWVEYDETMNSEFELVPGRLLWVKSRQNASLTLGNGITLPVNKTFEITLAPNSFTDISVPFRFNIRLSDIIKATGNYGDSLYFYEWRQDSETSDFTAHALYLNSQIPPASNKDTILECRERGFFTIRNTTSNPVILKIPPIAATQVLNKTIAKRKNEFSGWYLNFNIGNSNFGYDNLGLSVMPSLSEPTQENIIPTPPSFKPYAITLLGKNNYKHGAYITRNASLKDGQTIRVLFENFSNDPITLNYSTSLSGNVPGSFSSILMDQENNSVKTNTITLEPGEKSERILAVGDKEYLQQFPTVNSSSKQILSIKKQFGQLKISFSSSLKNANSVSMELLTLKGELVKRINFKSNPNTTEFVWILNKSSKVNSGIYCLVIKEFTDKKTKYHQSKVSIPNL